MKLNDILNEAQFREPEFIEGNIKSFAQWTKIKNQYKNDDTFVIEGSVNFTTNDSIPNILEDLRIDEVGEDFFIGGHRITSLKGCPNRIGDEFSCSNNNLTILEHGPDDVNSYLCYFNKLTSLEGAPKHIPEKFDCSNNELTTLKGGPEIVGDQYICVYNKLVSLEGCPAKCKFFTATDNKISTIEFLPEELEHLQLDKNKISSLIGIHKKIKKCVLINVDKNPIKKGGIGILLIEGIKRLDADGCGKFSDASIIINKYLGQGKAGLLACQEELEEAGLGEFAKL